MLKTQLRALMKGRLNEAPAPRVVKLRLPMTALGRGFPTIIDTQGFDSAGDLGIEGRRDIHDLLRDPDVFFIICSNFTDAPDPVSVRLLEQLPVHTGRIGALVIVDNRTLADDADADERATFEHERRRRLGQ